MTGFNQFFVSSFALILTTIFLSASAQAATPDYAKILAHQPALSLIYTSNETKDVAKTHKPGLPDAGKMRIYWFWGAKCLCNRPQRARHT